MPDDKVPTNDGRGATSWGSGPDEAHFDKEFSSTEQSPKPPKENENV